MTATHDVPTACIRRPGSRFSDCTCPDCLALRSRVRKAMRFGLLPPRPDNAAAWERIDNALTCGWTESAIASASRVPKSTLHRALTLRAATGATLHFSNANASLLVGPWGEPTVGRMDVTGSRRRVQALCALGWSLEDLSTRSGVHAATLGYVRGSNTVAARPTRVVNVRAAAAIRRLYEELSNTPCPNPVVEEIARKAGYVPPAAWENIDDPDAVPSARYGTPTSSLRAVPDPADGEEVLVDDVDDVAVALVLAGQDNAKHSRAKALNDAERVAAVRIGTEQGMSAQTLAGLLDVAERSVARIRQRHGIRAAAATWDEQLAS